MADKLVKQILAEEFGFALKYGSEFNALPAYRQELTLMLERKGLDFKIARANFDAACRNTKQYVEAAHKVIFNGKPAVPLGIEPWDVQSFFHRVLVLTKDIQDLIDIYNA